MPRLEAFNVKKLTIFAQIKILFDTFFERTFIFLGLIVITTGVGYLFLLTDQYQSMLLGYISMGTMVASILAWYYFLHTTVKHYYQNLVRGYGRETVGYIIDKYELEEHEVSDHVPYYIRYSYSVNKNYIGLYCTDHHEIYNNLKVGTSLPIRFLPNRPSYSIVVENKLLSN